MASNNIPQVAEQVVAYLNKHPEMLSQFVDHPYSTVQTATGASQQLDRVDMSQLLTAAATLASGQTQSASSINSNNLASLASNLLGQNDNSIHSLASSLFGGAQQQVASTSNVSSGSGMGLAGLVSMASLASGLLGTNKKKKPTIDLSDGLGMDDLISVAGSYLTGQTTNQKTGLDLGDIASIASMFLK